MEFGRTLWDATAESITWDAAADAILWNDPFPISSEEAGSRPPWEIDEDWPLLGVAPDRTYRFTAAGGGTVTVIVSFGGTSYTVTFAGTATAATIDAAFLAQGVNTTSTGGPLGTSAVVTAFDDWTIDQQGGIRTTTTGSWAGVSWEFPDGIYPNDTLFYRLIVIDAETGEGVFEIGEWHGGKITETLNEAARLEFMVPATDADEVADITNYKYRIRVLDRWGLPMVRCRIQEPSLIRDGDAVRVRVVAEDALAQLSSETIGVLKVSGGTVADTVSALLALQAQDGAVGLGTIDSVIGDQLVYLDLSDTTILAALREIQAQLPMDIAGAFYIDGSNAFHWRQSIGKDGKEIRLGERLRALSQRTSYKDIATRVYLYGEGQDPDSRLTLLDAGEANEYVQSESAITDLYGVVSWRKQDTRFTTPAGLLKAAQRILEEKEQPRIEYDLEALDLSKINVHTENGLVPDAFAGTRWEDLYVGGEYLVVDGGLGVSTEVRIRSIDRDLTRPVPARVQLDNAAPSLGTILTELAKRDYQPLDVDGDRYPSMGRNYSGGDPEDGPRDGDVRFVDGKPYMFGDDGWNELQQIDGRWGREVAALPAVPTSASMDIVKWVSTGAGTGDDQLWIVAQGQSEWRPLQDLTTKSGTP